MTGPMPNLLRAAGSTAAPVELVLWFGREPCVEEDVHALSKTTAVDAAATSINSVRR